MMKKGQKIYIKETGQFGRVESLTEKGSIHQVSIITDDGPKIIDVIERGYNVITLVATIWKLILEFIKNRP